MGARASKLAVILVAAAHLGMSIPSRFFPAPMAQTIQDLRSALWAVNLIPNAGVFGLSNPAQLKLYCGRVVGYQRGSKVELLSMGECRPKNFRFFVSSRDTYLLRWLNAENSTQQEKIGRMFCELGDSLNVEAVEYERGPEGSRRPGWKYECQ